MELLVATTNRGKIREIQKLLKEDLPAITLYSLDDLNIKKESPETGESFLENAAAKAAFYSSLVKDIPTIADDSGLVVASLDGAPGIHSARYAGSDADDEKNIEKLLKKLSGIKDRRAKFVCTAALAKNGQLIETFTGQVKGIILHETRGSGGFGYDPLFFYPPLKKTFAQLSTAQKNRISHRAKALQQLKDFLIKTQKNAVPF